MIRKLFHISLAIYITMLSGGIVLNKHYCGTMLESIAVYFEADPCCDGEAPMEGCCHNETTVIYLEDDFVNPHFQFSELSSVFQFAIPIYTLLSELIPEFHLSDHFKFSHYSPPLLITDIQVEVQSFLL